MLKRNQKGQFIKGHKGYWLGKGMSGMTGKMPSESHRRKISEANTIKNPGYTAIHVRLRTKYGNASKCENPDCVYPRYDGRGKWMKKPKKYEYALIHGEEHGERENYMTLCCSCHRIYDLKGTLWTKIN